MTAPYRPAHLSVSAVDCYATCPANYRRRYVQRMSDPPTAAMAFGHAMAVALEALHRGQDGEQAWLTAYGREVQLLIRQGQHTASLRHGLELLALYQARGVGQGTPEWRFQEYLPDRERVPVPLLGYLDLATDTEVWEFKCSKGGWDQDRVDHSLQAHVYRWAFLRARGRAPECVRFLVFSTVRVQLDEYVTYPSGGDLALFEQQAAVVWKGIVRGEFPPRCGRCTACALASGQPPKGAGAPWELEV